MRTLPLFLLPLAVLLCAAGAVKADTPDPHAGWFPFVVPDLADARTAGTPMDLSFLNPEPAGAHGFLKARGETLVDGRGTPVRLFGSNITDYHTMPPKEYAPRIAERLRQLGINFIRLHYADWDVAPNGILNPDHQTLNPEKLDQWDYLIANLKRCGIYVDINLHVARSYAGMPDGWHRMGKGLDILHEPYIESQKQYAHDLLTHVNPYTKTAYINEPAVAIIELNNENTALTGWERYASLPERFSKPLQGQWNAWLREKYKDTAGLRAQWNANAANGPELLRNAALQQGTAEWSTQNSGGAEATLAVQEENGTRFLRWDATHAGSQDWHLQFYQQKTPLQHGKEYVLTFRARAKAPGSIQVSLMQQQEPWHTAGQGQRFALTPEWRTYGVSWTVQNPEEIPLRLNFQCGNTTGTYDLADLSLREGSYPGLTEGESLEAGTVALPADSGSRRRTVDYLTFLMDQELRYAREMKQYVQGELGAKSLVYDTQVNFGGLAGQLREATIGDAVDGHAYPDHPRQVNDALGRYWAVNNYSMLGRAFGSLEWLALQRVAGKPYCVTEFDLNPPNDHSAETFPLLSLMAAYQGWNAIADYAWYNFQGDYGQTRIRSAFATTGHAGQMALVPASALLYRLGLVQPAAKRVTLDVPTANIPALMSENASVNTFWSQGGVDATVPWRMATAVHLSESGTGKTDFTPATAHTLLRSDTGEITFDRTKDKETLVVNAPAVRLLIGRVGGREFSVGDTHFQVAPGTYQNYANIALAALDGKPVAQSRKLLLTTVARVENKGQVWNAERTGIGPNWGEGPTLAEPVQLTLTLPGKGWTARALDGSGQPLRTVAMNGSSLTTGGEYQTVWYLLER